MHYNNHQDIMTCSQRLRDFIKESLNVTYGNHIEFSVIASDTTTKLVSNELYAVYNTSLERDAFYNLMYKMMDTHHKYNQKQYKEMVIGSVYYQNSKNEEINIHNIHTHRTVCYQNQLLAKVQQKNKLTILSLPSTMNINMESHVRKLTFRVTNRVFVNFENGVCDDHKYYKITVNYNHDKDVDLSNVIEVLEKTLSHLL